MSRQDVLLPAGSQTSDATAPFILNGKVDGFSPGFSSGASTDFSDQLQILIDPEITDPEQIIDFSTNPLILIIVPTIWNSGGGELVIASPPVSRETRRRRTSVCATAPDQERPEAFTLGRFDC